MIPTPELKKLKAFHNKKDLKKSMVAEVLKHQKQDQIVQGTYGKENGQWKGCAVACSVRSLAVCNGEALKTSYNDHSRYQTDLGVPEALAHLEDYLFEAMPTDKAKLWPAEFIKAINVGSNLSLVSPKFISATLRDLLSVKEVKDDKEVSKQVLHIAKMWDAVVNGRPPKAAAESAAWSAAESAAWSAAESAAWSAARSAAWSAARSAAESAARSAAWSAAWSAAAYKMSRRLLKIIKATK